MRTWAVLMAVDVGKQVASEVFNACFKLRNEWQVCVCTHTCEFCFWPSSSAQETIILYFALFSASSPSHLLGTPF